MNFRHQLAPIGLAFVLAVAIVGRACAEKPPGKRPPSEVLKEGWEKIDDRLLFLFVRLASVETSLEAIEKANNISGRKQIGRVNEAKRAEKSNELMDRKGGGPVKWSEFYGRTAEKFFYHPANRNSYYHTTTVLGLAAIAHTDTSGVPLSQRPPQFDYIYKANSDAKARAERDAAELANKIDALQARRRDLEEEQSALWCEIAFRAVAHYDLDRKALYRFQPKVADGAEAAALQKSEAMRGAAIFMQNAMAVVDAAQKDQAVTFAQIKTVVANARDEFGDSWLKQRIEVVGIDTAEGKFAALAKKLEDVSANLADSYQVSIDGDRFKDEQRKERFRGLLQDSLSEYAQILLALDEVSSELSRQWQIVPDVDAKLEIENPIKNIPAKVNGRFLPPQGAIHRMPERPLNGGDEGNRLLQRVTLRSPYGRADVKCDFKKPDGTWNIVEGPDNQGRIRVACRNCGKVTPSLNNAPLKPSPTTKIIATCRNRPFLEDLTVERAVTNLLQQVGVAFDFNGSRGNIGELANRLIKPEIANMECDAALKEILDPLGLAYVVEDNKVILKRKK